ncbi:hypothetical protein BBJ28_00000956 [Nothophytophthora sp. Chile5]|nr:hypothetical protein BBJ28_00000956 [Nothophytophthora sp. Chile5]
MGRGKRILTHAEKQAIVRQSVREPEWKQLELAQWAADTFQLERAPSQSAISVILSQKIRPPTPERPSKVHKPKPKKPKAKAVKCPELETAMIAWLDGELERDVAVTTRAVQHQAQKLLETLKTVPKGFAVSDRWVDNFMKHHLLNCPFGVSDDDSSDAGEGYNDANDVEAAKEVGNGVDEGGGGPKSQRNRRVTTASADSGTSKARRPKGKRKREATDTAVG